MSINYGTTSSRKTVILFISENVIDEYTQDMYVYVGMPVIAKKTKHDGGELLFANSETFTIGDIDAEYISMYNERPDENGEKEMYVYACPISVLDHIRCELIAKRVSGETPGGIFT